MVLKSQSYVFSTTQNRRKPGINARKVSHSSTALVPWFSAKCRAWWCHAWWWWLLQPAPLKISPRHWPDIWEPWPATPAFRCSDPQVCSSEHRPKKAEVATETPFPIRTQVSVWMHLKSFHTEFVTQSLTEQRARVKLPVEWMELDVLMKQILSKLSKFRLSRITIDSRIRSQQIRSDSSKMDGGKHNFLSVLKSRLNNGVENISRLSVSEKRKRQQTWQKWKHARRE